MSTRNTNQARTPIHHPRPLRVQQTNHLTNRSDASYITSNRNMFNSNQGRQENSNLRSHKPNKVSQSPPKCAVSFQTGYDCGEMLEALKSIQAVVQCYSCHKSMTSARTCLNGHGICSNCRNRCNKNCPVCKAVILDLKPVMLNEIIKLLPRSCNFSPKGCESLIFAKDSDHETFCRFRTTDCRMPSCDWKGMAKDLLLHLENFHGEEMIRVPTQTQILMAFNTRVDKDGLAVIVAFNNIFWRHVRVHQNQLFQFYQYIPMERPKKKFTVMIEYHTPEDSFSKTVPVYTDVYDRSKLFTDKESFCLPRKIAQSFNHFHSGVHFTFKIEEGDN